MTSTLPVPPMTVQPPPAAPPAPPRRSRSSALFLGRLEDPRWVRPSLLALLVVTAVLYIWGLGASGWGNAFYSAAVQAGSESWKDTSSAVAAPAAGAGPARAAATPARGFAEWVAANYTAQAVGDTTVYDLSA
jgi:hypothetical protein